MSNCQLNEPYLFLLKVDWWEPEWTLFIHFPTGKQVAQHPSLALPFHLDNPEEKWAKILMDQHESMMDKIEISKCKEIDPLSMSHLITACGTK